MNATQDPSRRWAGSFGAEYHRRDQTGVDPREAWLRRAFHSIHRDEKPRSVLELGAGEGQNLDALCRALPWLAPADCTAVDIDARAVQVLLTKGYNAHQGSVVREDNSPWEYGLVMTRGLLIHIHPENLPTLYRTITKCARRWVLIGEYYNPTPVEVPYRGEAGMLWKRDFAGEIMQAYPKFKLRDYGFVYHGDPVAPQDDITWFLLERSPEPNTDQGARK